MESKPYRRRKFFLQLLVSLLVVLVFFHSAVTSAQTTGTPTRKAFKSDSVLEELLARPAPYRDQSDEQDVRSQRPQSFYDIHKAPPDDAPINDLIDYWEYRSPSPLDKFQPSVAVSERLLELCESEPERLTSFLPAVSKAANAVDRIKKLYDSAQGNDKFEQWREEVQTWLLYNSRYFLGDLLQLAQNVKEKGDDVTNEEALQALAKVDWETALPLLQAYFNDGGPRTAAIALALLYRHANDEKELTNEERYRGQLQAIATDRNATARARAIAIEELSLTKWSGHDEWYLSLFEDETLLTIDDASSPLTTVVHQDPDHWIPVLTKLIEGKNQKLRDAAARCLISFQNQRARRDALLPLLPWLSDPSWVSDNGNYRLRLIQSMSFIDVPESVPGLIWVVGNDKSEYNRSYAAQSLVKYKDPSAALVLSEALTKEKKASHRGRLISGLLGCGGLSDSEQLVALEAFAEHFGTTEGSDVSDEQQLPVPVLIGQKIARLTDVPDSLVNLVVRRADVLQKQNPKLARNLLSVVQHWQTRQLDLNLLERIASGNADAAAIANAIEQRAKLRASVSFELQSLAAAEGVAPGIAAVLLDDASLAQAILDSNDDRARAALLASARLILMPLPVGQVGSLLQHKDKLLALAAERYLLAEDSTEARKFIWEHYPDQAFITGWRENNPLYGWNFSSMDHPEKDLQAELFRADDAPVEIFAIIESRGTSRVLRVYSDRSVYTYFENEARSLERVITADELRVFRSFLKTTNLLDLGPKFGNCHVGCRPMELLALNRQAGRRVFSYQGGSTIFEELLQNFRLLARPPD